MALASWACAAPSAPAERIILVVIDMLRSDHVQSYGGTVSTPRIDELAASGRRFQHAVSSYHATTMSMAALFTGRTPTIETGTTERRLPWNSRTWCGLARFASSGSDLCVASNVPTLAEELSRAGYGTMGITSNPLLFEPSGFSRGFDDWREVTPPSGSPMRPGASSRAVPFETVHESVENSLALRRSDRFFLYVHYMDVHDHAAWGRSYAAGVERADEAIGKLLDTLEEEGLLSHTVVVLTSDHGERLGEAHAVDGRDQHLGNPSFETLLRVPLIIAPAPDHPSDVFVRSEDVYRWIREFAGLPAGRASDLEADELFVSEWDWQTYRRGRWKGFRSRRTGAFHLIDLSMDPGERLDVADEHPEISRQQQQRMRELTTRLASPRTRFVPDSGDRERLRSLGYAD